MLFPSAAVYFELRRCPLCAPGVDLVTPTSQFRLLAKSQLFVRSLPRGKRESVRTRKSMKLGEVWRCLTQLKQNRQVSGVMSTSPPCLRQAKNHTLRVIHAQYFSQLVGAAVSCCRFLFHSSK